MIFTNRKFLSSDSKIIDGQMALRKEWLYVNAVIIMLKFYKYNIELKAHYTKILVSQNKVENASLDKPVLKK